MSHGQDTISRRAPFAALLCATAVAMLLKVSTASAQPQTLHFQKVTERVPFGAWPDRQGFVWIRFYGEPAIFDGVEFDPIDHIWPALSRIPPGTLPRRSLVDEDGGVWLDIGPSFARASGRFDPLTPINLDIGETGEIWTRKFMLDDKARVWIATSQGLICYDPSTSFFAVYRHDPSDPNSISSDLVATVAQDSSGTIWAGTLNGLNRLTDEAAGRFKRYDYNPDPLVDTGAGFSNASAFPLLYVDRAGVVWTIRFIPTGAHWTPYSFEGGLHSYDPATDALSPPLFGFGNHVTGLAQDRSGRYWIGTTNGLFTLDSVDKEPTLIEPRALRNERLELVSGNLFIDRHDILWIVTGQGLAKTDLKQQTFESYGYDPADHDGLTHNWVRAILMNEDSTVWIGTDYPDRGQQEGGLSLLDRRTGRYIHYKSDARDDATLSSNIINAIERAGDGKLWLGTSKGLDLFDPASGKTKRYYLGGDTLSGRPVRESAIETEVTSITVTESGELWLGMGHKNGYSRGLAHVLPDTRQVTFYSVDGDNRSLVERDGYLWSAGPRGLSKFDGGKNRWELVYKVDTLWKRVNGVPKMQVGREGNLWIATQGDGLWRFDPEEGALQGFGVGESRSQAWVSCVLEDDHGFIWVSSLDGLSRFDPTDAVVDHFSVADGLQGSQFASQGCDRSDGGELAFGGVDGLNVFVPQRVVANPYPPNVLVTSVRVNGERFRSTEDQRVVFPIEHTQAITLTGRQRNVSFEYVGLHFSKPQNLRYEYRLDGFDSDWQPAGTRRVAAYTNLDPGDYTFRVRAFNGRVQSESDASIHFTILTPWWASWWAYGVYLLLFGAVLYAGYSFRVRRLKARSEMLENLVAERTHDLEEEKRRTEEQAERLVELDKAKNRFFANISHEFRTPMTLILGPLQDLVDGVHGKIGRRVRDQLSTMRHSAERMLHLITQLLDLTRLDAGQLEVHLCEVDLVAHLEALVHSFVPMAEHEQVSLEFVHEEDRLSLKSDPDMLDKIVGNLLSNAIKFTPAGGNVWVTTRPPGGDSPQSLEILVRDTGPGIPKKDLAHIFDRFATFEPASAGSTSWTRTHEGVGIGLALAKELVELHKGTILVESIPGFGSTFTVRLPFEPIEPAQPEIGSEMGAEHAVPVVQGDGEEAEGSQAATILVVEDNADVLAYIRTHLCDGYRIVEAANGRDGLDVAKTERPDLILTDIMMPVMDGYAFCRAVKSDERLRNTPVVLLTARAGEESTLEGLESGADEYISKPFSMPELKARIANLIEAHRQMRHQFSREVVVQPAGITIESDEEVFLSRLLELINDHLDDSNFNVEWLADEMTASARHLTRRVKEVTGESPAALIRRMRLERASQLLNAHAGTVSEIAYRVGFKSVSQFSKVFRRTYGMSPSEWVGNRS